MNYPEIKIEPPFGDDPWFERGLMWVLAIVGVLLVLYGVANFLLA